MAYISERHKGIANIYHNSNSNKEAVQWLINTYGCKESSAKAEVSKVLNKAEVIAYLNSLSNIQVTPPNILAIRPKASRETYLDRLESKAFNDALPEQMQAVYLKMYGDATGFNIPATNTKLPLRHVTVTVITQNGTGNH